MQHILVIGPERNQNNGPSVFSKNLTHEIEKQHIKVTYISKENFKKHIFKTFEQYDSILINSTSLLPLFYAPHIKLYKKSNRKILFILHGEMGKEVANKIKKNLLQCLQSFLIRQSTYIVFVSSMFKQDFFSSYTKHIHYKKKSIVIPNGIDDLVKNNETFKRPVKPAIDVIYVGGTRLEKGYDLMQSFLERPFDFKDTRVNIHLVGITNTSHATQLKNTTIHYYPKLNHSEVINRYSKCDIFLSTSLYETYGIAIQEAYSRGCKIVTYKKAGVLELIEKDETVFRYDALTPESLYAALLKAIDSRKKQDALTLSKIPTWREVSIQYIHALQK